MSTPDAPAPQGEPQGLRVLRAAHVRKAEIADDHDDASWADQQGVLVSVNHAGAVLAHIDALTARLAAAEADAKRWLAFRAHAFVSLGEDGEAFVSYYLADDVASLKGCTAHEALVLNGDLPVADVATPCLVSGGDRIDAIFDATVASEVPK